MRRLWIRRKAVSAMIGGVIILGLFLTAFVTMFIVSQQFDQYQTEASRMSQLSNQRLSEYLVANPPGLMLLNSNASIPGWVNSANKCGTGRTKCYNMTVNNLGGVGVQIVRIYINSTGSGCISLCVLNPSLTIANYTFNQANQFVNRGEINHGVIFALPSAVALPGNTDPTQASFPMNAILIATSMGNVFSFQWPFQVTIAGWGNAWSQGIMKVAYQGTFDSSKEPGHGGTGTQAQGYCHNENASSYPAPPGYAEQLTGISGLASGNTLWFVNPWITYNSASSSKGILNSAYSGGTTLYLYIIIVNTGNSYYSPTAGTLDLTWFASNHIDGTLFGVYYNGHYSSASAAPSIAPNTRYYAIFKILRGGSPANIFMLNNPPGHSVMFWGSASITSNTKGNAFYSGTILSSGLWIRYEASSTSPCV